MTRKAFFAAISTALAAPFAKPIQGSKISNDTISNAAIARGTVLELRPMPVEPILMLERSGEEVTCLKCRKTDGSYLSINLKGGIITGVEA